MASKTSLNIDKDKAYIISGVIALSTLSVLAAVILFDHSFDKQEIHCNTALCADVISISSVSFGILSIGNPIAVGVVSFSRWVVLVCPCLSVHCAYTHHLPSFVAIGIIPIAPM